MSRFHRNTLVLALAALLALPIVAPPPASAGTERYTTITSLPYVISSPGGYKLTGNLTHTNDLASAITITSDNVTLDFDGFTIVNQAAPIYDSAKYGVFSMVRSNVRIRNGTLRSFIHGIRMTGEGSNAGCVIEDMTLIGCRDSAISTAYVNGVIIRRCNVADTGIGQSQVYALNLGGKNAYVHDNVITNTRGTSEFLYGSTAINLTNCAHATVERNTIANEEGLQGVFAIHAGMDQISVGNLITNFNWGVSGGIFRDNICRKCGPYAFSGGVDAGNNSH